MNKNHATFRSYLSGFLLSLALTIASFYFALQHIESGHVWPPHPLILYLILGFAVAQFLVQSVFFLHLGKESRPHSNLIAFLFTLIGLLIVIGGSLWIMSNLNYNMIPADMNTYMLKEEGMQR